MKTIRNILILMLLAESTALAQYYGDIAPSTPINFNFTSRSFSTAAPTTLSGSPAVLCYKDNGTTPSSSSGITLQVDVNGVTGQNNLRIDTSANAAFFTPGSDFACSISAGTVGGTSVVGEVVAAFSIAHREVTIVKGVAFPNFYILMQGATGNGIPSLTPNCNISKDGGALQATTNGAVELSAGLYKINFTATETTANNIFMICTGGSAIPFRTNFTPRQ